MTQSNFSKNTETTGTTTATEKKLGVYTLIDESGNVTQIKKERKSRKKYYPNAATKVETVIGEVFLIGVSDTTPMGIGDNIETYARYD